MEDMPDAVPNIRVTELYRDGRVSMAEVALNGLNWRVINHRSTTTYVVESGAGSITVGVNIYPLHKGAAVAVPVGTPYQSQGEDEGLVMIATSVPPYEPESVQYLGI